MITKMITNFRPRGRPGSLLGGLRGDPDLWGALYASLFHRRFYFGRRHKRLCLLLGLEVMRDRHVIRVFNGLIDGLTGDTQLPLRTGEGVINLTPSRVVGHFVMDVHAHNRLAHCPHYQLLCVLVSGKTSKAKHSPNRPVGATCVTTANASRSAPHTHTHTHTHPGRLFTAYLVQWTHIWHPARKQQNIANENSQ